MVTKIGRRQRAHLYIEEHMRAKGLSDETVANRVGVARETIWKWRTEQHRLNQEKLALLASALDMDAVEFYRPPGQISIDAIVAEAPDNLREAIVDFARKMTGRG